MALLKFALLCIDLVGWPAIALVYPLFVSIRAVETGSGYHMRKLVRYWIIFSLFSLLEFAFVKIIEWIPFWSGVRLAVSFCLVMPQFEGACLAYQGLVSSVIDRFGMLMEERLCKRKTVLDILDKYINENGSEALEKLIASQMTPPEASVENRCPETPLLKKSEQEWTCGICKITNVGESTLNAHLRGSMHKSKRRILKASMLNEKDTGSSPLWQVQHTRSFSAAWDLKGTYAAAEFKERMPPKQPENPLLKKAEQEWTCDLCKVTTASKSMLNAHLQGSKHKSNLESPKASFLDSKDTGPSPLVEHAQSIPAGWDLKGTYVDSEVKEMTPPKETAEKSDLETPLHEKAHQEWNCDQCKVTTTDPLRLNGHLQGCKHKAKLETILKESLLDAKDTGPILPLHSQPVSAAWDPNRILEAAKDKELMLPKETAETRLPETPLLKKAQQEWTAFITNAEHAQSIPAGWDLKGTYAAAEVKEMPPNETAEKWSAGTPLHEKACQEWNCDLCKVTTTDPLMFNGHLQGCSRNAKLKTIQKESLLEANDTGPFSPLVQHAQPVSATWDLNRTLEAAKDKEMMPLKETAEMRLPETPLLKNSQQELTGDLCKVTNESELILNDHLQGSQHKSKLETTLKSSFLEAKDTGPSPSQQEQHLQSVSAAWDLNGTYAAFEDENIMPPKETTERRLPATPLLKKDKQEWTDDLCKVPTESMSTLNDHLQASNPEFKLETTLEQSFLDTKDTGPSTSVHHMESVSATWDLKKTFADAEVEDLMPPKETAEKRHSETPLLKKVEPEGTDDVFNVTTKSKLMLNDHVQGNQHKSKLESTLKASLLKAKDTGPSSLGRSSRRRRKAKLKTIQKESLLEAKDTGPFSPLVQDAQPLSATWDLYGTLEAAKDKEMMQPKETTEMRPPETPLLKKSQQELTGDLSKVTTESELMLNDHLQGSQHKSKLETTLKASLLEAKDTGPSPSQVQHLQPFSAAWDLNGTYAAFEDEKIMPPKETAERRLPATPLLKKDKQEWTGDLCKVPTESMSTLNDHLEASNPKSKLELTLEVERAQSIPAACEPKGSYAAAEVKEIMSPKETAEKLAPGTPLLKKSCQEWTCDLCKVTTPCEITLNGHLQGRKHKAKLETIRKESLVDAKDTGSFSPLVQHTQPVFVFAACDLKGTLEAAKDKEIMPPKETAEQRLPETPLLKKSQQEWTGDLCRVTTESESMLNGHLQGSQHKSKLETTLNASSFVAEDTEPSPSVHHMESVSATWDLKGTYAAAEVEDLMPPKETAENRHPETSLLKKVQPEGTGDVFNVTPKSESMLNDHVQGNQHRSKLESSLEASLLKAKDTGPSSLTGHFEWSDSHRDVKVVKTEAKSGSLAALQEVHYAQPIELSKRTYVNTEVKETMPPSEASRAGTPPLKKEWSCGLCKVKATCEKNLNAHLLGSKHKAQLQTSMKESLLELEKHTARKTGHVEWNDSHKDVQFVKSEAKNGSSALQEVQYAQPIEAPKRTYANAEVKETMPPPEASRPGTPPLKKEWSCGLCKVKAACEQNLNAHLLGSKHKAKLESLKNRKGKPVVLEICGTFKHWCIICDAKLISDVDLASHIGGKRHASRIDEIEKLETSL